MEEEQRLQPEKPASPIRPWTVEDAEFVRVNAARGAEWIAHRQGRPVASVRKFARSHVIELGR